MPKPSRTWARSGGLSTPNVSQRPQVPEAVNLSPKPNHCFLVLQRMLLGAVSTYLVSSLQLVLLALRPYPACALWPYPVCSVCCLGLSAAVLFAARASRCSPALSYLHRVLLFSN